MGIHAPIDEAFGVAIVFPASALASSLRPAMAHRHGYGLTDSFSRSTRSTHLPREARCPAGSVANPAALAPFPIGNRHR